MNTLHNYKLSENRMYYYIKTHMKNSKKPTCIPQKHPLNSVIASDACVSMRVHAFAPHMYHKPTSAVALALVRLLA